MKKSLVFAILIILVSFVIAIYSYPHMPEQMASHWNAQSQVDGYMSKFWGTFLMPIVAAGVFLMFLIIPLIDPLKKNIEEFRQYFDGFILIIMTFLLYIYILTLLWNYGIEVNIGQYMLPAIGVILFYAGVLMEHAKRNWFIGIRTPWTLSSEKVWNKTHKVGSKAFKILGLVVVLSIMSPEKAIYILLVSVFAVTIFVFAYSYFEYQKIKQ